ncbi:uncharacterized protein ALTATR162_LOCUS3785 [Alternaria atra]|uniref:Uncharacterized protein n=1 Tax=Alternaria atra TaxID=119953 RepID=A0A8J2I0R1_9PLEO|nr:uncharacterized protein ALTATR162_LOCUS3785 [Alternaria atra]CAG5155688.1 unnamed protein product [Alternaria atra]
MRLEPELGQSGRNGTATRNSAQQSAASHRQLSVAILWHVGIIRSVGEAFERRQLVLLEEVRAQAGPKDAIHLQIRPHFLRPLS